VNGQDSKAEIFDVFLCHNNEDKQAVREIAQKLSKENIKPWLDEADIRTGSFWHATIGQQIESVKSAAVFVGTSGVGPWQSREIIALLDEFDKRGCPIIPAILPSDPPKPVVLPWSLKGLHCVDFRTDSQPLKRLIWGITGQKPAELGDALDSEKPATTRETTKPRLIAGRDGEAGSDEVISESRLYPPLAERPDPDNATQLNILRKRVSEYWVDGVLKHSLHNEVLMSLEKREVSNAVDAPWKYTVEVSDAVNPTALDNRDVSAIYDATGLLLILGEPGSGKTTTLLDLARILLERARNEIKERVSVVLNLSSWKKKQPIEEWISNELSEKYRVPRKIARIWLQSGHLLPLLDGLDEVETVTQPDCVAAINAFIEGFKPSGLVVCCRLNEYRWLPKRLKLNGAICIEPLGSEEVSKYLAAGGPKLMALRQAVDTDPVLQELTQTPLMLGIMSLAYQGADNHELAEQSGYSLNERRKQVFGLYVDQMFQRKAKSPLVFPKEQTISWLSWLAGQMRKHSQSVFLVEGLQPGWLGTRAKRAAYGTVVALCLGLMFGAIFGLTDSQKLAYKSFWLKSIGLLGGIGLGCWSESPLKNSAISGSIFGLIFGIILDPIFESGLTGLLSALIMGLIGGLISGLAVGSLNHIILVETMSWKWNQFWKRTIPGSIVGLIVGLIFGLILGLPYGLVYGLDCGLIFGLIFGPILGVGSGLAGGFTDRLKVGKESPNEGIRLSLKNFSSTALVTFLIVGLSCGSIVGLSFGLSPQLGFEPLYWINSQMYARMSSGLFAEQYHRQSYWLRLWLDQFTHSSARSEPLSYGLLDGMFVGLIVGLTAALIVGLNRGGCAVIKHYALRLILWLNGYTPFKFIGFLDHCAKLIFLKKVGGGYIFIHRMLLDYFADLPQSTKGEDGKTGSVTP
jgi:eukaryotic-like serine/threonine-protein kinase